MSQVLDFLVFTSACPGFPEKICDFGRKPLAETIWKQMVFALWNPRPGNACFPNENEAEFHENHGIPFSFLLETHTFWTLISKCGNHMKTNGFRMLETQIFIDQIWVGFLWGRSGQAADFGGGESPEKEVGRSRLNKSGEKDVGRSGLPPESATLYVGK